MRCPGDIIFLLDLRRRGRDREGAAALLGRELVQRLEFIAGHSNDLGARFLEFADRGAERMRFSGAAAGEGLGKEIEYDRAILEHVGQVNLEILAADCAGSGKIRGLVTDLERCRCWRGDEAGGGECEQKLAHDGFLQLVPVASVASLRLAVQKRESALI